MIELILVDWFFNRVTILPTFLFLMGITSSSYINVLMSSITLDLWLHKFPFNIIVLNGLYFINKRYFKRSKRLKNFYLQNLFNLGIYYSLGFLIFNEGLIKYGVSILIIVVLNSIFWLGSYSFKNNS